MLEPGVPAGTMTAGEVQQAQLEDMQPDDVCQLLAKLYIPQVGWVVSFWVRLFRHYLLVLCFVEIAECRNRKKAIRRMQHKLECFARALHQATYCVEFP